MRDVIGQREGDRGIMDRSQSKWQNRPDDFCEQKCRDYRCNRRNNQLSAQLLARATLEPGHPQKRSHKGALEYGLVSQETYRRIKDQGAVREAVEKFQKILVNGVHILIPLTVHPRIAPRPS
jgi:hypothetical protein